MRREALCTGDTGRGPARSTTEPRILLRTQGPNHDRHRIFSGPRGKWREPERTNRYRTQDRTREIGAGLGSLTRSLADLSMSVTTIEIDPLLEPILRETLAGYSNIRVVYGDFLKLDLQDLLDEAFGEMPGIAAGNIPYYIT